MPKRRSGCFFEFFFVLPVFQRKKEDFFKTNKSKKQIFSQTFKTIVSQKMIMQKMMKEQFLK